MSPCVTYVIARAQHIEFRPQCRIDSQQKGVTGSRWQRGRWNGTFVKPGWPRLTSVSQQETRASFPAAVIVKVDSTQTRHPRTTIPNREQGTDGRKFQLHPSPGSACPHSQGFAYKLLSKPQVVPYQTQPYPVLSQRVYQFEYH